MTLVAGYFPRLVIGVRWALVQIRPFYVRSNIR